MDFSLSDVAKVSDWSSTRENLSHSEISFRIVPNQSEKCFESQFMEIGKKLIQINSIQFGTSIRMNPNQFFQPESLATSDSFGLIKML